MESRAISRKSSLATFDATAHPTTRAEQTGASAAQAIATVANLLKTGDDSSPTSVDEGDTTEVDPGGTIGLIVRAPGNNRGPEGSSEEASELREAGGKIDRASKMVAKELARDFLVQTYGIDEAEFHQFAADTNSTFSRSASAGQQLDRVNDHAGILIVPVKNAGLTIAERMTVVSEVDKGVTRYFIKGYGDRIVPFEEFKKAVLERQGDGPEVDMSGAETTMETSFRTRIRELSEGSELQARRSERESDQPTFPKPLNPSPLPKATEWDNFDDNLAPGFGRAHHVGDPQKHGSDAGSGSGEIVPLNDTFAIQWVERELQSDRNKIENRFVIFLNKDYASGKVRPPPAEGSHRASIKVGGPMLAQIDGLVDIEIMGPVGQVVGVKASRLNEIPGWFKGNDIQLRITSQDGAIHELRITDRGAKMSLVMPRASLGHSGAGAAFGAGPSTEADVDLYSYYGVDTGPRGSVSGFADPMLITSCGDRVPAGPFLHVAGGARGAFTAVASSVANVLTLQALPKAERTWAGAAIKKVVNLGMQFGYVDFMTIQVAKLRTESGSLLGGPQAFNASAGGVISASLQAGVVASTVAAQEAVNKILGWACAAIPDRFKVLETRFQRVAWEGGAPALGEYVRLLVNCGTQKLFGLERGSGPDAIAQFIQSLGMGAGKYMGFVSGNAGNHRALQIVGSALVYVWDTAARTAGTAGSVYRVSGASSFAALYAEALATRVSIRGLDKLLSGFVADCFDAGGVVGPHAGAYSYQVSREARVDNVVAQLQAAADELVRDSAALDDYLQERAEASQVLRAIAGAFESVKPALNRMLLSQVTYGNKHNDDRSEADKVVMAVLNSKTEGLLRRLQKRFSEMVSNRMLLDEAVGDEDSRRADDAKSDVVISIADLPLSSRERTEALHRTQRSTVEPHPTRVNYDGRSYPSDAEPGHAKPIRRSLTTFSETAQAYAKGVHDAMLRDPGLMSIREEAPGKLPAVVIHHIEEATRNYTIESQMFHYPLRWERTGQRRIVPVAPGVVLEYNVLNSSDGKLYDPIGALYVNLGAMRATKFPSISYRAVVTEAAYRAPVDKDGASSPRELVRDLSLGRTPVAAQARPTGARVIESGAIVQMTEILSSSMSRALAAAFGNALGFGTSGKERTQMMVIHGKTPINITAYTHLIQAEIIAPPGALFRVVRVDEAADYPLEDDATLQDADPANRPLAQVVYLEQVNTYEWESNGEGEPGQIVMDPVSGHLFKVEADEDGEVKRTFMSAKNYVVGNDIERPDSKVPNKPSTQLARWLYPYTSDFTPRTTKDAIHAAILTDAPIAPYLDEAIKNAHHEHFRNEGGYKDSPAYQAETKRVASIKERSKVIVGGLAALKLEEYLHPAATQRMAWLLTSMLRKPIKLVWLDDPAFDPKTDAVPTARVQDFDTTYDRVDISVKVDGSPNPAVLIGVSQTGFHAIEWRNGKSRAVPLGVNGASLENFLHAYVHGAQDSRYEDRYVFDETSGSLRPLRPEPVAEFHRAVIKFANSDYIVLQQAIVELVDGSGLPADKPSIVQDDSRSAESAASAQEVRQAAGAWRDLCDAWDARVVTGSLLPSGGALDEVLGVGEKRAMLTLFLYAADHPSVGVRDLVERFTSSGPTARLRPPIDSALSRITRSGCEATFDADVARHVWDAVRRMRGDESSVEGDDESRSSVSAAVSLPSAAAVADEWSAPKRRELHAALSDAQVRGGSPLDPIDLEVLVELFEFASAHPELNLLRVPAGFIADRGARREMPTRVRAALNALDYDASMRTFESPAMRQQIWEAVRTMRGDEPPEF